MPLTPIRKSRLPQKPVIWLFPWLWISLLISFPWEMNLEHHSYKSSGKGHEVHIITGRDPISEFIKILTCQCLNYFLKKRYLKDLQRKRTSLTHKILLNKDPKIFSWNILSWQPNNCLNDFSLAILMSYAYSLYSNFVLKLFDK